MYVSLFRFHACAISVDLQSQMRSAQGRRAFMHIASTPVFNWVTTRYRWGCYVLLGRGSAPEVSGHSRSSCFFAAVYAGRDLFYSCSCFAAACVAVRSTGLDEDLKDCVVSRGMMRIFESRQDTNKRSSESSECEAVSVVCVRRKIGGC